MSTRQSTARDAGYLVGSQAIASACAFATGVVLARTLGPLGKGFYDVALGSATLLGTFTGLSLSSGVFYYSAKGGLDQRRLVRVLTGIALAQAVAVAALLASFVGLPLLGWLLPEPRSVRVAVLIAALLFALQSQQLVQAVVRGHGRFRESAVGDVAARVGTLAAVVGLAAAGSRAPLAFTAALAASTVLSVLVLTRAVRRAPRTTHAPLPVAAMAAYSLPLYLGNAAQFLNYRLDIFFVNHYLGLSAVGQYTVAVWIAQIVWLIPNAMSSLVTRAVAANDDPGGAVARVAAVNRLCLYVSLLGAAGIAVAAQTGIAALFGRDFSGSVLPLLTLAPGVVLFSPTIILSAYLNGIRRQAYTTWVACASLVVTVVGNLVLIPRAGIAGAAAASAVSYALSTVITVSLVARLVPAPPLRTLFLPQPADVAWLRAVARVGAARVRNLRFAL